MGENPSVSVSGQRSRSAPDLADLAAGVWPPPGSVSVPRVVAVTPPGGEVSVRAQRAALVKGQSSELAGHLDKTAQQKGAHTSPRQSDGRGLIGLVTPSLLSSRSHSFLLPRVSVRLWVQVDTCPCCPGWWGPCVSLQVLGSGGGVGAGETACMSQTRRRPPLP